MGHSCWPDKPYAPTTVVLDQFMNEPTKDELWPIMRLMLEHMGMEAIRTNETKHGNEEIQLREAT